MTDRAVDLLQLHKEMRTCAKCDLANGRNLVVPGEGPADAEVVFIGEAPGFNEDRQGVPFIGPAGNLLEELIVSVGLTRKDVFICNVVKCRPPNNRDPLPIEIDTCRDWLEQQLGILNPLVVCTLGRFSMARYFTGTISRVHGQAKKIGDIWYLPLYHPAAALHQGGLRPTLFADIAQLPQLLETARAERSRAARPNNEQPPDVKQLSLF